MNFLVIASITISITAILWFFYKNARDNGFGSEKDITESEKTTFFALVGIAIFLLSAFWLVPTFVTGSIVKEVINAQDNNCREAYTEDGENFSSEQCSFFQNVLNGKYTDGEPSFDIQYFLEK